MYCFLGLMLVMSQKEKPELAPWEPDPVIEASNKHIDRTLIRKNLVLTVDQRFENLMAPQKLAMELRRGGRRSEGSR
jgi:hypothetical protein